MIRFWTIDVFQVFKLEGPKLVSDGCQYSEVALEKWEDYFLTILRPECLYIDSFWLYSTFCRFDQVLYFHQISFTVEFVNSNNWSVPVVIFVGLMERQVWLLFDHNTIAKLRRFQPFLDSECVVACIGLDYKPLFTELVRSFCDKILNVCATVNEVLRVNKVVHSRDFMGWLWRLIVQIIYQGIIAKSQLNTVGNFSDHGFVYLT